MGATLPAGDPLRAARWAAWAVSGAVTIAILTQPVSTEAQLALATGAIGLMAAIWVAGARDRLSRSVFLALASLVAIRYVYWRLTSTMPSVNEPVSFGLAAMLLGAELYCVFILALSLVVNADPLERTALAPQPDSELPSVDVLIPSYNEDEYILATTIAAALALDYPADRLTVWLLDDGGTDEKCADPDPIRAEGARARRSALQRLCSELGARYVTRARNEHAKAGNLNSGLAASRGEIVAVLDADHAPFRSFLRETIGHFARDPKLFLVQTPHVFLNPDPIERNLRTFDRMPSENEMFYDVTQRGLDKWNGSFFCGSAALLRRAALAETNGFSGETITEDCETAFELHARGWTSVYVDKPLIAGLQPETFASFIGQRSRWCQGMLQIMLLKNPVFRRGLKPIQRLAYLSTITYWFFPLPRLAFMLAPLLHIFFDVKLLVCSIEEAVAYTATYVVMNVMVQNYLFGHVRWPWVSELYEYVQGVFLAKAMVSVAVAPRKPTFRVTEKGVSREGDGLSGLATPFFVIFALLALGVATAAYRYLFEPGVTSLMLIVGLWCLFNLAIAGAALGVVAERRQAERTPSLAIARQGLLTTDRETVAVAIERISAAGCSIRPLFDGDDWPPGGGGRLRVDRTGPGAGLPALPVTFESAGPGLAAAAHFAFVGLQPRDYVTVADLMYADTAPIAGFLATRRERKNLLSGTLSFAAWSVAEPVRAFGYALEAWRAPEAVQAVAAPARASAPMARPAVLAPSVASATARATETVAAIAPEAVEVVPVRAAVEERFSPERWLADILVCARAEMGRAAGTDAAPAGPSDAFEPDAWLAGLLEMAGRESGSASEATPSRRVRAA